MNKVITAAAAIESGAVSITQRFQVPASMQVDEYTIHDSHAHPVETMTLGDIIAESSNIGIAKVAGVVGQDDARVVPVNRFGFGRHDRARVPGRGRRASCPRSSDWSDVTLATDLVRTGRRGDAAADGVGVRDDRERRRVGPAAAGRAAPWTVDGTFTPAPASPTRRVLQPQTASILTRMLAYVVEDGTGTRRRSPAIRWPARRAPRGRRPRPGGYYSTATWPRSSGSCRPATPRVVIAAILDEPATVYGGVAAAPLFQQVARYAIQRLGIPTAPPVPLPPHALGRHDLDRPADGGAGKLGRGGSRLPPVPFADLVAAVPGRDDPRRCRALDRRRRVRLPRGRAGCLFFCVPGRARRRSRLRGAGGRGGCRRRSWWSDGSTSTRRRSLVPSVREAMGPMSRGVRAPGGGDDDRGRHRHERQDHGRPTCSSRSSGPPGGRPA